MMQLHLQKNHIQSGLTADRANVVPKTHPGQQPQFSDRPTTRQRRPVVRALERWRKAAEAVTELALSMAIP